MTLDKEELLKSIVDSFSHLEYINADDIPNIDCGNRKDRRGDGEDLSRIRHEGAGL